MSLSPRCTSGQHISSITQPEKSRSCGRVLTLIRDPRTNHEVRLCPVCDGRAAKLAKRASGLG